MLSVEAVYSVTECKHSALFYLEVSSKCLDAHQVGRVKDLRKDGARGGAAGGCDLRRHARQLARAAAHDIDCCAKTVQLRGDGETQA